MFIRWAKLGIGTNRKWKRNREPSIEPQKVDFLQERIRARKSFQGQCRKRFLEDCRDEHKPRLKLPCRRFIVSWKISSWKTCFVEDAVGFESCARLCLHVVDNWWCRWNKPEWSWKWFHRWNECKPVSMRTNRKNIWFIENSEILCLLKINTVAPGVVGPL